MANYARLYRLGITPWERYAPVAAERLDSFLDEVESERGVGRAVDLGCGKGRYVRQLVARGWEAVGVDAVPAAIAAARRGPGTYLVRDVTELDADAIGTFDLLLDVGCFQGLDGRERQAYGRSATAVANHGATLLSLQFGNSRYRRLVGGVSPETVRAALPQWEAVEVEPAATARLGWPMSRTSPAWYRFRLQS